MTLVTDRTADVRAAGTEAEADPSALVGVLGALPAVALAAGSLLLGDGPAAAEVVRAVLVVLWATAGAALTARRRHSRLGPLVLVGATIGGLGALAGAMDAHRSLHGGASLLVDLVVRLSAALLPAVALHLLLALPDGVLGTVGRRRSVIAMYVASAAVGVALLADRDSRAPLADRAALARRPRWRPGRCPRPLPGGRSHRSPADAVGRLGAGRRW